MRIGRYFSVVCLLAIGVVPLLVSTGADAANNNTPPTTAGPTTGGGGSGGGGGGSIIPKPSLKYPFDGNLTNILGGNSLTPDTRHNQHFAYVAGRDGKNPGGIEGMGIYPADPHFFYGQQWTAEFNIFPTNKYNKAGCDSGTVFFDGFTYSPVKGGAQWADPQNAVSVTACGVNSTNPAGKVALRYFVTGTSGKAEFFTMETPMTSNTWHGVKIIYDSIAKKMALEVDGAGTTKALPGPMLPCYAGPNCVLEFGGPIDLQHGFDYGTMDNFVFYPSANWPLTLAPRPVGNTSVR